MRLIALIIMLIVPSWAAAFGEMVCKVKTNNVTSISEGQPKIFNGFKESFKVGDTIELDIVYYDDEKNLLFSFIDRVRGEYLLTTMGLSIKTSQQVGDAIFTSDKYRLVSTLDKNMIRLFDANSQLVLKRYYKSDYAGYFVQTNPIALSVHTATFDCRTEVDVIDDILQKFFE